MTSGQYRNEVILYIECVNCDYRGRTDARYDPEIDRHSVVVDCPICGLDWEVRFDA